MLAISTAKGSHGLIGSGWVLRILLVAVPLVLAGYALDDRGFAYLASVPRTPLFAGEILLVLGAAFVALATGYLRLALRHNLPMAILLVFVGWGLLGTLPMIPLYGLDSIRDAALWYYALMAVLVAALVMAVPDLPHKWACLYGPFLVVLLIWSPVGTALAGLNSPTILGTGIPLFSHKLGNTSVTAATAIAFLWLVPAHVLTPRRRALLTALATIVILAAGTQQRGGLVGAAAAVLLTGALSGRRWNMAAVIAGTVLLGIVLGWGLNLQVPGGQGRAYSVGQLVENVVSIPEGQNSASLGGTVAFRDELWSGALNLASEQGALATGLGFGPNIAQELGISPDASDPLRSPHNSHIDILTRMGIIGAVLWVAFWVSWYVLMLRRSRNRSSFITPESRGLIKFCVVGVTAILVNAYFDPTLESPQVAIWLWTLVGLGLGIVATSIATDQNTTVATRP
jgi:hypothetical protein